MHILYRICEKQATGSGVPRFNGLDKRVILKKCWKSLQETLPTETKITLITDHVSQDVIDWFKDTAYTPNLDILTIEEDTSKNGGAITYHFTIKTLLQLAAKNPDEVFYLCNDDFLHLPDTIDIINQFYQTTNWPGFVTPYDYPDRYTLDKNKPAHVLFVNNRHWRTIPSDTGVTTAKGSTWLRHANLLLLHSSFNSDGYTWEVYAKDLAICPIPGLTTHLSANNMTPGINWDKVWDKIHV